MNFIKSFHDFIQKYFLGKILPRADKYIKHFWATYKAVQDKEEAFRDVLVVSGSLIFYHILHIIAVLFFWVLPQGRDVLYCAIEDSTAQQFGTAIWLTISTLIWGICAEFAARFRVYAKDNSGLVLSQQRVNWRRVLQKFYAKSFLMVPFFIMIIGCFLAAYSKDENAELAWGNAALLIGFLVVGMLIAYNCYFNARWEVVYGRWFSGIKSKVEYKKSEEKRLKESLLGIYNHFTFRFNNAIKDNCREQIEDEWRSMSLEDLPAHIRDLPFNDKIPHSIQPPIDKSGKGLVKLLHINFPPKDNDNSEPSKDVYIRWIYSISYKFYPILNRELKTVVIIGLIILIGVPLLPISIYSYMGAAALIALAFAGWIAVSSGFLFLDIANVFKSKLLNAIPWRFSLAIWMLLVSYWNLDHPARLLNHDVHVQNERPTLQQHFRKWLDERIDTTVFKAETIWISPKDTIPGKFFSENGNYYTTIKKYPYKTPVLFVCAEGGALRTGAMSASLLSQLQDSFPWFKGRIYAFSTVSGGTVGVGFFNATTYLSNYKPGTLKLNTLCNEWFTKDYLAPVMAKLFYGDLLQLIIPVHIPYFDRAIALEEAWECGYSNLNNGKYEQNIFYGDFLLGGKTVSSPAWFINTAEVETGHQCWISNVKPTGLYSTYDTTDNLMRFNRDVLSNIPGSLRYSTAMGFSARFPLISPAAAVSFDCSGRYHYVDGGYVENTGAQTMLEVLIALSKDEYFKRYAMPYVMMIRFGPDDALSKPESVKFGNELSEIVSGIYNTRAGRTELSKAYLNDYVKKLRIENMVDNLSYKEQRDSLPKIARLIDSLKNNVIDLEVSFDTDVKKVPMNWVLSSKSMQVVGKYCKAFVTDTIKTRPFINQLNKMDPMLEKKKRLTN